MPLDLRAQLQTALGTGYQVGSELRGGAMSRLFLAHDEHGNALVVKVLPPELAASVRVERFKREIEMAGLVRHPNIVPLLDAGRAGDVLYYTMPFVGKTTLRDLMDTEPMLAVDTVLSIVADVGAA